MKNEPIPVDADSDNATSSDHETQNYSWEKEPAVLWVRSVAAVTQGQSSKIPQRLEKFRASIEGVLHRCEHEVHDGIKSAKWKKIILETNQAIAMSIQPAYKFIS